MLEWNKKSSISAKMAMQSSDALAAIQSEKLKQWVNFN